MNLGGVFMETVAAICVGACLLALLVSLVLRYCRKTRRLASLTLFVILASVLFLAGLYFAHRPLFAAWHRSQNVLLPQAGCLTYEPSFFRLYASYRMSRAEFDAWIKHHPWHLSPYDKRLIVPQDAQHLGLTRPDAAYASEPAPNGRQLRVYYENGIMYASYWAM
jgi:hypothetical protein